MKWYQTIYAKVAAIVAAIALFGTFFGYLITIVNWWNEQQNLPSKVRILEQKLDSLERGDIMLQDYIDAKNQSYAVGFRVLKVIDDETGKPVKVKQYRDWDGKFHDIYVDLELTEFYGWEQYYYIDPVTHEKIYV